MVSPIRESWMPLGKSDRTNSNTSDGFSIRRSRKSWKVSQKPWYIFCFLVGGTVLYIFTIGTFAFVLHTKMERSSVNLFYSYVPRRPWAKFLLTPRNVANSWPPSSRETSGGCKHNKHVNHTLVTFIKSKVSNGKRRELLRRSWNSICYLNGWNFRTYYLIGRSKDVHSTRLILEEQARYGDILQYDGPDDYVNMPLKVLAGMEWAYRNLPENFHYASADDDFLVDLAHFTNIYDEKVRNTTLERVAFIKNQTLHTEKSPPPPSSFQPCEDNEPCIHAATNRTDLDPVPIMCLFRRGDKEEVNRKKGSKWFVSRKVYSLNAYPRYCHGGMYVMPIALNNVLLEASFPAPVLRLDDVWITGILRVRAGIPDYMVADLEPIALHYGPRERKGNLYEIMDKDWGLMLGNMTLNSRNNICKCEL